MQSPRRRGIGLAAGDALPAIYFQRRCMAAGTDLAAAYRQADIYAGKIPSGARPAELPVMQSDKFELLINVKVAKSLGIKISDNLLSLADEVIE
jgi:putative tryptophan/tyrosine transport system substrate-binding protein